MLTGKKIVLIGSGSIAVYKLPNYARDLIKKGASVRTVLTKNAEKFVSSEALEVMTGYPVLVDGGDYPGVSPHLSLAKWADMIVVVPATANLIAKMANGIADDWASTTLVAFNGTTLIAPAMNDQMWEHSATQRNVKILNEQPNVHFIGPEEGFLAEGYSAKGRMVDGEVLELSIEAIFAIEKMGALNNLNHKKVVVTSGGTEEPIDPVRILTNKSSGKMGQAIAYVASLLGAEVTWIKAGKAKGKLGLPEMKQVEVSTAQQLQQVTEEAHQEADITIMAAAVSDFKMKEIADQKIKKKDNESGLTLELEKNPDILKGLAKENHFVVGFAAETQNIEAYAQKKLREKGANLIVANDVSNQKIGFGSDENSVTIYSKEDSYPSGQVSKFEVAAFIFSVIEKELKN